MVQPTNRRIVTEAAVAGHIATQITTPGSAAAAALNATYGPEAQAASAPLKAAFAAGENGARDKSFGAPQHEDGALYTYPNRLNFGPVAPAGKVISPPPSRGIDLIAHWYNDFGLESTASAAGSTNGWYGWYDWNWNFPTNTGDGVTTKGYDPQRHPLQGFYQGDNATVLDWQAKWLAEGGINAASLVASNGANPATWSNPTDTYHWMYQLFENAPNFQALRWMMWLKHGYNTDHNPAFVPGDGQSVVEQQWAELVTMFSTYPNAYLWQEDGKVYPVVYLYDGEQLRGAWDNYVGATKTTAALKWLADQMKAIGYDGVMVLARNSTSSALMSRTALRDSGVLYVAAGYSNIYTTGQTDFAGYAENAVFPTAVDEVPVVQTSFDTMHPHGSTFNLPGSTPALFGKALRRAVRSVLKSKQRRMLLINNVSEWAESGPGLLPNVADKFGYLDQVRSLPALPTPSAAVGTTTYTEGLQQRVSSTANAASLTVTVPAWARRVELKFLGTANTTGILRMRINGDTGASYDTQYFSAVGATVTAAEEFAATSAQIGTVGDASGNKSTAVVSLDNNTSGFNRSFISQSVRYGTGSAGGMTARTVGGGWRNAAPVTSLTVLVTSGYFRDGSVAEVYCWA